MLWTLAAEAARAHETRDRGYAFRLFLCDQLAAKPREANNAFLGECAGTYNS
jgi:hypothetical protein